MTLEIDSTRSDELFLRLPPPFQSIIITPPRESDSSDVVKCLNDERVYNKLNGPPFPYTPEDFASWHKLVAAKCAKGRQQYLEIIGNRETDGTQSVRQWADAVPVRYIREVDSETGEQTFLGDIGLNRQEYGLDGTKTVEQRKAAAELNDSYEAGDERIEWTFGDFLVPSHHGRGIMTAVMGAVIDKFAIPYLNAHRIIGEYFEFNIASKRVFEKNGFVFQGVGTVPVKIAESKGGGEVFQGILLWERQSQTVIY